MRLLLLPGGVVLKLTPEVMVKRYCLIGEFVPYDLSLVCDISMVILPGVVFVRPEELTFLISVYGIFSTWFVCLGLMNYRGFWVREML
jgi:hypothetical protein